MRFNSWCSVLMAAGVMFSGCGSDSDKSGSQRPINPNPPLSKVVPEDFKNTANSKSELDALVGKVDEEIATPVLSSMHLKKNSERAIALFQSMFGRDVFLGSSEEWEIDDDNSEMDDDHDYADLSAFLATLSEGDDCQKVYTQLAEQVNEMVEALDGVKHQAESLNDHFEFNDESGIYDVENLESDRYAFHVRLALKDGDGSDPFSEMMRMMMPDVEFAVGASDKAVALFFVNEIKMDSSEMEGVGHFYMRNETEMFANFVDSSLTVASSNSLESFGEEVKNETTFMGNSKLVAGEKPRVESNVDFKGEVDGENVVGFANSVVEKASNDSFVVSLSGNLSGQSFEQNMSITKTADSCTVKTLN